MSGRNVIRQDRKGQRSSGADKCPPGGTRKAKLKISSLPSLTFPRAAEPGELVRLQLLRDPGEHQWPPESMLSQEDRERLKAGKLKRRKMLSLSVNSWDHVHWRVREKLREEIYVKVREAAQQQLVPSFLAGRPYLLLVYYFRTRAPRDWANWTGKHLVDALVHCGIIVDDNDRAIDMDRPILLTDPAGPRVEFWLLDTRAPSLPLDQARLEAIKAKAETAVTRPQQALLPGTERLRRRRTEQAGI